MDNQSNQSSKHEESLFEQEVKEILNKFNVKTGKQPLSQEEVVELRDIYLKTIEATCREIREENPEWEKVEYPKLDGAKAFCEEVVGVSIKWKLSLEELLEIDGTIVAWLALQEALCKN